MSVFDASGNAATRERRQALGERVIAALSSLTRNARTYAAGNDVFKPALAALAESIFVLLETDGAFDLELFDDGLYLNRQQLRFDAIRLPLALQARTELRQRGVFGLECGVAVPESDLVELVRLFAPESVGALGPRGDPERPLLSLRLKLSAAPSSGDASRSARLVAAYAHAVFFVDNTIAQLRRGGQLIPVWAASRVVQDLVDLQQALPERFLELARSKAMTGEYWGFHAANVSVLAIAFGARLSLSKARRHDLGMAALFHDIGMAAIPDKVLDQAGKLGPRATRAVHASALFAARAMLRERETHAAALERALAVHECHLDLLPPDAAPAPRIGLPGRVLALCESYDALTTDRPFRPAYAHQAAIDVMRTEQAHRFDQGLLREFPQVVAPLAGKSALPSAPVAQGDDWSWS